MDFLLEFKQIYFLNPFIFLIYTYSSKIYHLTLFTFYPFINNFQPEKTHFPHFFQPIKHINFPQNITTPTQIIQNFQHSLQQPTLHHTIQHPINHYQNK
ncbi:YozE family protein [Staphylococcus epidermidis]|uniref:YozE family protein n=1 Tax=Staphylococcus epidermidis TaxID=1282 RepID=UPI0028CBA80F|nr:YozE family protein [Staphylococcus epidermidis]